MILSADQQTTYTKVKTVMDRWGIPEYIWFPISISESNLNPGSHNPNGEDSRGIFQINVKAHPQWLGLNLYDPTVNAEIAAEYFMASAYQYASGVTPDKKTQASIVWFGLPDPSNPPGDGNSYSSTIGGIKPKWTPGKYLEFQNTFNTLFPSIKTFENPLQTGGQTSSVNGSGHGGAGMGFDGTPTVEDSELTGVQTVVKGILLVGLVVVIGGVTVKLLTDEQTGELIASAIKAYGTGGVE